MARPGGKGARSADRAPTGFLPLPGAPGSTVRALGEVLGTLARLAMAEAAR